VENHQTIEGGEQAAQVSPRLMVEAMMNSVFELLSQSSYDYVARPMYTPRSYHELLKSYISLYLRTASLIPESRRYDIRLLGCDLREEQFKVYDTIHGYLGELQKIGLFELGSTEPSI